MEPDIHALSKAGISKEQIEELDGLAAGHETMSREELAKSLAESVDKRVLLLKIMSMNHYDMEANSRMECWTAN